MSYLEQLEAENSAANNSTNTSESAPASADENSEAKSDNRESNNDQQRRSDRGRGRYNRGGDRKPFKRREHDENEKIAVLSLRRVAKVREGSNRLSFSALVVSGDMKGSFGIASTKAREASLAIQRAAARARKLKKTINLLDNRTLHQDVEGSYCATKVLLRKAKPGTGIVAGKIVRAILECLGGSNLDVVTKVYGSRNPINVAKAVLVALAEFMDE